MKFRIPISVFLLLFLLVLPSASFGGNNAAVPIASIINPDYHFDPVVDGTKIIHEFIIKNSGNSILDVTNVNTP